MGIEQSRSHERQLSSSPMQGDAKHLVSLDRTTQDAIKKERSKRESQEQEASQVDLEEGESRLVLDECKELTPEQIKTLESGFEIILEKAPLAYHQSNCQEAQKLLDECNAALKIAPPNLKEALAEWALHYINVGGSNRAWMKADEKYQIEVKNGMLVAEAEKGESKKEENAPETSLTLDECKELTPEQIKTLESGFEIILEKAPLAYHQSNCQEAQKLLDECNAALKIAPPNLKEGLLQWALRYINMGGSNRAWMKENEKYQISIKKGRLIAEEYKTEPKTTTRKLVENKPSILVKPTESSSSVISSTPSDKTPKEEFSIPSPPKSKIGKRTIPITPDVPAPTLSPVSVPKPAPSIAPTKPSTPQSLPPETSTPKNIDSPPINTSRPVAPVQVTLNESEPNSKNTPEENEAMQFLTSFLVDAHAFLKSVDELSTIKNLRIRYQEIEKAKNTEVDLGNSMDAWLKINQKKTYSHQQEKIKTIREEAIMTFYHSETRAKLRAMTESVLTEFDRQGEEPPEGKAKYARAFGNGIHENFGIPLSDAISVMNIAFGNLDEATDWGQDELLDLFGKGDIWERGGSIGMAIGLDQQPFRTRDDLNAVMSCLFIAKENNGKEVVDALIAEKQPIADISLERSAIIITATELGQRHLPLTNENILAVWKEIKKRQIDSFKSEDIDENGKQKSTDVVYLAAGEADIAVYLPEQSTLTNAINGSNDGKALGNIIIEPMAEKNEKEEQKIQKELEDKLLPLAREYQKGGKYFGRHLVIQGLVHGGEESSELGPIENILRDILDPSTSSVLLQSCYGGMRLRNNVRSGTSIFQYTGDTASPIHPHEKMGNKMLIAYAKAERGPQKGFQNADIDRDGQVSLGELRYWLDANIRYQDAVGFDKDGKQVVDTNKQRDVPLA